MTTLSHIQLGPLLGLEVPYFPLRHPSVLSVSSVVTLASWLLWSAGDRVHAVSSCWRSLLSVSVLLSLQGCDQLLSLDDFDEARDVDSRDVLALKRIILDMATADSVSTKPEDGFIHHVRLNNNRFVIAGGGMGVSFYRTYFAWVGFNVISAANGVTTSTGVQLDNTMNSWVYSNTIKHAINGILVSGDPGEKSLSGSCWNGIGVNWDEVTKEFTSSPNDFHDVTYTVYYGVNYCVENSATSAVCEH
jgi:hypothetical protein